MADSDTVTNAVRFVGDFGILPGTSQLLEGNIQSGLVHAVVGLAAKALIGPAGLVLVAANSFSQSTTNKSLVANITGG